MTAQNLLLLLCLAPAIPLGELRKSAAIRALPKPLLMIVLTGLGVLPLLLDGRAGLASLAMAGLLACYGFGEAVARLTAHLRGEARSLPAPVARALARRQRAVWLCRSAVALLVAAMTLQLSRGGDPGAVPALAILLLTAAAGVVTGVALRGRQEWSDRIHLAELERYFAWADRSKSTDILHVPNASVDTIKALDRVLKELASAGIRPGLICRGRGIFAAVRRKHVNTWLVRSTHDLDDFAAAPIRRCFHMRRGTNGSHIVALRKLRQVSVDYAGTLSDVEELPKDLRMFDEIWIRGRIAPLLRTEAAAYGITLQGLGPAPPPMMPAVPQGRIPCFALIVPAAPDKTADLGALAPAMGLVSTISRRFPQGYRLVLGFESAPDPAVTSWLSTVLGADLHPVATAHDAINSAPALIWTPAIERILPQGVGPGGIERTVLRHAKDLAAPAPASHLPESEAAMTRPLSRFRSQPDPLPLLAAAMSGMQDARLAVHLAADYMDTPFHVTMWAPHLNDTGIPWYVICREYRHLLTLRGMGLRGVWAPEAHHLPVAVAPAVEAIFYVNNAHRNIELLRDFPRLTHVQMLHGDSDKPTSYSPVTASFDRIFVAGQLGQDRYALNGVTIPDQAFVHVGRPQVRDRMVGSRPGWQTRPVIAYMPTWFGSHGDTMLSSLDRGAEVIRAIRAAAPRAEILFKPHPLSYKDPSWKTLETTLSRALADTGTTALDRGADANQLYARADLLVTDISSTMSDYLYSDRPIAVILPRLPVPDQARAFPTLAACYQVAPDLSDIAARLADALGGDSLAPARKAMRLHAFGPDDGPADARFIAAVRRIAG